MFFEKKPALNFLRIDFKIADEKSYIIDIEFSAPNYFLACIDVDNQTGSVLPMAPLFLRLSRYALIQRTHSTQKVEADHSI